MGSEKKGFSAITVALLAALLLLFGGDLVTASNVTINVPAANAEINGTKYTFNVTLNVSEDAASYGMSNFTVDLGGSDLFWDDRNFTEGVTEVDNYTIDTSTAADGSRTFAATLKNYTGVVSEPTVSVTVDNTAPSSITASKPYSVKRRGVIVIDLSSNDVTTVSYSTVITDPDSTIVDTKTGSSITLSGDELGKQGTYTLTTTATDNIGYSSSLTSNFDVVSSAPVQSIQITRGADIIQKQASGQDGNALLFFGGGALVLVIIGVLAMSGGKKRR